MPIPLDDMADRRALLIAGLIVCSCSLVKENRDPCPCRLDIHVSGTHGAPATVMVENASDSYSYSVMGDTLLQVFVPRGKVSVTAWSGAPQPAQGAFMGSSQTGFPPLYLCHCTLDARGEEVIAHARLRKQFCTLRISVEGPPGWGPPIGTAVRGYACGMNITGLPLEGPFHCSLGDSPDNWSLRIPRQDPDSPLLLDIVLADSVVRTFSLGTYLKEASFDWSAPDLADLDLQLSLSVTSLTVLSPSWNPPTSVTVVI